MKKNLLLKLFIFSLIAFPGFSFGQKNKAWKDTLDLYASKCKPAVLCGDEMFFTTVDQMPYVKMNDGKKVGFMEVLQEKLSQQTISGDASMSVEIIVNCKGEAGGLKLLKYGDKGDKAELELVKALNSSLEQMSKFFPAKNEGKVVNYKADKLKIKASGGKITVQ